MFGSFRHFSIERAGFFRSAVVLGSFVLILFVFGCGDLRHVAGRPFNVAALEDGLVVGQSSEEDVRAALRQPDGIGRYHSPTETETLVMWSYNYEHGTLPKRLDRNLLFVFFRDAKYDGYIWFSDTLTATAE